MNKNNENDLFLTEVEGVKEFHLDVNKAITEKKNWSAPQEKAN